MRLGHSLLSTAQVLFVCGGLSAQPTNPSEELRRAREVLEAGKFDEAITIYEGLLAASPDNATLLMNLVVAHYKAGHYGDVIKQCRKALESRPNLLAAWLFLGASHFQLQQPDEAIEPLRKVVAAKPDERNARLMLAESLLLVNRYQEAFEQFQEASKLLSRDPRVWYGLNRSCTSLAEEAFASLKRLAAESGYVHALMGDSYVEQQRYGAAFHHYREALKQQPRLGGVHASLAGIYQESGRPDWAEIEREKEKNRPPRDCSGPDLECSFFAGEFTNVLRLAERGESPEALYWQVKAYKALAEEAFERLSELAPSAQFYELMARNDDERENHVGAARQWREALRLAPGNPILKKGLAVSLYRARDFEAALPLLEELIQSKENSSELEFLRGSSLLNMGQPKAAVAQLAPLVEREPNLLSAHGELGRAQMQLGNAARAIPHLQAALPIDEDGSLHYRLARAYQLAGRREAAKKAMSDYQEFKKKADTKMSESEKRYRILAP